MYDAVVISRTNINIRPYELPGLRSKSTQKISRSDSPMAVDSNLGRPGLLRPEVGPERVVEATPAMTSLSDMASEAPSLVISEPQGNLSSSMFTVNQMQ